MALRFYQEEAINETYKFLTTEKEVFKNPLIVLPTGAGKSHVISGLLEMILEKFPNMRFLILAHRKELVVQNSKKFQDQEKIGFYCKKLHKKELHKQITIAMIQSIAKIDVEELGRINLILVDECHLIGKNEDSLYLSFLNNLRKINPKLRIVGLTATPFRLDSGFIIKGQNSVFTDIVYNIEIDKLIDLGFLCKIISRDSQEEIDTSGIKKRGGEFIESELEKTFLPHVEAQVKDLVSKAENRNKILIFSCGIKHALKINEFLIELGFKSAVVTGATKNKDRIAILEDFETGDLRFLINCDVLTTGYDAPNIDCIALLRATQSCALYMQMVGRGLRLHESKDNCLVLDYGENIARHGPINDITVDIKNNKVTKTQGRHCKGCNAYYSYSADICPHCGTEPLCSCTNCHEQMTIRERKELKSCPHCKVDIGYRDFGTKESANFDILQKPDINGEFVFNVQNVQYFLHIKDDKTSLKFVFNVKETKNSINLFLFPEHNLWGLRYCKEFLSTWKTLTGEKLEIPELDTSRDIYNFISSCENNLIMPTKIVCKKDKKTGKFFEVQRMLFDKKESRIIGTDFLNTSIAEAKQFVRKMIK